MVTLTIPARKIARASLITVWGVTALVSLPLGPQSQGDRLLRMANVSTLWHNPLMLAGAGLCWLPVVWLQLRMSKMADAAVQAGETQAPPLYWRYARRWELLGYPAFVAMVVVFWLMVNKPSW